MKGYVTLSLSLAARAIPNEHWRVPPRLAPPQHQPSRSRDSVSAQDGSTPRSTKGSRPPQPFRHRKATLSLLRLCAALVPQAAGAGEDSDTPPQVQVRMTSAKSSQRKRLQQRKRPQQEKVIGKKVSSTNKTLQQTKHFDKQSSSTNCALRQT